MIMLICTGSTGFELTAFKLMKHKTYVIVKDMVKTKQLLACMGSNLSGQSSKDVHR